MENNNNKQKAKTYVRKLLNNYTKGINDVKRVDPYILKHPDSKIRTRYEFFAALVNKFLAGRVIDFNDPNCPFEESCKNGKENTRFCCKTTPLTSSSSQITLVVRKMIVIYEKDIQALETYVKEFTEVTPENIRNNNKMCESRYRSTKKCEDPCHKAWLRKECTWKHKTRSSGNNVDGYAAVGVLAKLGDLAILAAF